MQTSRNPYPIERLISALSYFTAGFAGVIWLIIAALSRKRVTPFIMYHVSQAIFLSVTFFLISLLAKLVFVILYKIPIINTIPYLLNMPLVLGFSIVQLFTTTVMFYLVITSIMGYYSYLPWVSDIVKANTRNY